MEKNELYISEFGKWDKIPQADWMKSWKCRIPKYTPCAKDGLWKVYLLTPSSYLPNCQL